MAETKTKKKFVNAVLPRGVASRVYLDKPDDKAPEGVSWKPDGKYKTNLVYDSADEIADLREKIVEMAKENLGSKFVETEFKFPWRDYEDEEGTPDFLKNKTVVTAKTKAKPKVVDAKRNPVPDSIKVRGGDVIKASVGLNIYEQIEKVREGRKTVEVKVYGCNLYLNAVQLIQKRAGGGSGADAFDEEDGFSVDEAGDAGEPGGDEEADF